MAPIVNFSCKESFSVLHYINSAHLSNTANKKTYGVCNNFTEHMHEYTVEVITRGTVDSCIGTVTNLSDLKSHLRKIVVNKLDGKNLNKDVEFFKTNQTTMENLAIFIWQSMKQQMEQPELLHEIKLTDKAQNCAVYNGSGGYVNKKGQMLLTSDTD